MDDCKKCSESDNCSLEVIEVTCPECGDKHILKVARGTEIPNRYKLCYPCWERRGEYI